MAAAMDLPSSLLRSLDTAQWSVTGWLSLASCNVMGEAMWGRVNGGTKTGEVVWESVIVSLWVAATLERGPPGEVPALGSG